MAEEGSGAGRLARGMVRKLPGWGALFAQVEAEPEGGEHLAAVIRYLLWIGDEAVHHPWGGCYIRCWISSAHGHR
jgi:hypothetical protein